MKHLALTALITLLPAAVLAQEASLYDFTARFQDQDGRTTTLEKLGGGKPVMITMFYGTCPHACPMLVSRMKRIERKLPEHVRKNLRVILVSFDPKRDTVASLKKLQVAHGVDTSRWSLVRTDDEDTIEELAAVLGIKYRFQPDGSINHSSVVTLLDHDGSVIVRMDGLDLPDETILEPAAKAFSAP